MIAQGSRSRPSAIMSRMTKGALSNQSEVDGTLEGRAIRGRRRQNTIEASTTAAAHAPIEHLVCEKDYPAPFCLTIEYRPRFNENYGKELWNALSFNLYPQ